MNSVLNMITLNIDEMNFESQGEVLELLINSIPYPHQMRDIDLSYDKAVYFTWRDGRYKIELATGMVDLVDGKLLVGDNTSILIKALIERTYNKWRK